MKNTFVSIKARKLPLENMKNTSKHNEALTGIRFIAALMIFIHHSAGKFVFPANHGLNLASGVTFFFVLSGFVLMMSYGYKIQNISTRKFILIRFIRLWPAHISVLVVSVIMASGKTSYLIANFSTFELFAIVTLFQSWFLELRVYWGWNGPSWSISAEIFFYIAFPFLAVSMRKRLLMTTLLILISSLIFIHIGWQLLEGSEIKGWEHGITAINPIARLKEFMIGMACYLLLIERFKIKSLEGKMGIISELITLLLFVLIIIYSNDLGRFLQAKVGFVNGRFLNYTILAVLYGLIIVFCATQKLKILKFLTHPVLVYGGNISFAFYLVHQPIIYYARRFIGEVGMSEISILISVLLVSLASASFIYHFIEMPSLRLAKKKIGSLEKAE